MIYSAEASEIVYGFNRFNDNIFFTGMGNIDLKTDYGNFLIQQNYSGNATLFNQTANLNDNQNFTMLYDYKFKYVTAFYKQRFYYVGDNYSDFAASSLINSNQLFGLGYKLNDQNYLSLFYGMDNHLQLGQASIGGVAEVESKIAFDLADWNFISNFDYKSVDRSFDREENLLTFFTELGNSFDESNLNISFNYNSLFNNYLRVRTNDEFNIENRDQDQIDLSLRFSYKINENIINTFSVNYGVFDRNNSFREFDDNNSRTGVIEKRENDSYLVSNLFSYYQKDNFIKFGINYYDESFQNNLINRGNLNESSFNQLLENEKLLDYQNNFTRVKFESMLNFKEKISLRNFGMMEINRMNTPSEKENKDRDLLTLRLGLEGTYQLSRFLDFSLLTEGRARHLVYLRSEFSADNNWERTLRFKPQFNYHLGNFKMIPSFEIYVSYRDFDFPDISTNIRSDAQRLMRVQDSLSYKIDEKYSIRSSYFYLYKETGKLDWENFSQSIDEIKQEYFINLLLYFHQEKIITGFGVRYYVLENRSQIDLLAGSADIDLKSISPETNIIWQISDMTSLEISGYYEFRFNKNTLETIPNLYMQTNLNF